MVDDGRRDMKGDWGWVIPAVLHEKEMAHKVSVSTLSLLLGVLLLVGSVIHMQYNTHGLYFMKRNNAKDTIRYLVVALLRCCVRTAASLC